MASSLWWPVFWTLLIVMIILGLAWWLKYMGLTPGSTFQGRFKLHLRCALGPREQLVVVQIEDRALLLGVTAHSIQVLDRFTMPLDKEQPAPAMSSSFSVLLDRLRQRAADPPKEPS